MLVVSLPLGVLAYVIIAAALFGDPLRPIGMATVWSDHLGIPPWRLLAILCAAMSALVFARPFRMLVPARLRLALCASLALLLPTVIVGIIAGGIRHRAVVAFGADEIEEHSFFASIRNAPAEHQFFLHAAMLKSGVAYAWSCRDLAFHALEASVGANVLPSSWVERCAIDPIERR